MTATQNPDVVVLLPHMGIGGVEKITLCLLNAFVERGLVVHLILVQAKGELLSAVPPQVRVIDLKSGIYRSFLPIARYLNQYAPHVMFTFSERLSLIALLTRKLTGIDTRIVICQQTTLSPIPRPVWKKWLEKKLVRIIYPWADALVCASNGVAQDVSKFTVIDRNRLTYIYNPAFPESLQEKLDHTFFHPWFRKEQPPVIVSVGRLAKQKNYVLLLHAFAKVEKHKRSRLVIIGDGPERPSWKP